MSYEWYITRICQDDLTQIYTNIANYSGSNIADIFLSEFYRELEWVCEHPYAKSLYHESPWREKGVRRFLVWQYRVFYSINEELKRIEVRHIIHSAQDLRDKFVL